jgi:hypothetical protein
MSENKYLEKIKHFWLNNQWFDASGETSGGDKARPARAFARTRPKIFGILRVLV